MSRADTPRPLSGLDGDEPDRPWDGDDPNAACDPPPVGGGGGGGDKDVPEETRWRGPRVELEGEEEEGAGCRAWDGPEALARRRRSTSACSKPQSTATSIMPTRKRVRPGERGGRDNRRG